MRRYPLVPTLVVGLAVAVMLALGFWQLQRMRQKDGLLQSYAAARHNPEVVDWAASHVGRATAQGEGTGEEFLYRRARLLCVKPLSRSTMAGRNRQGQAGVAQIVECAVEGGGKARVVLGWSANPQVEEKWQGGEVVGVIAPGPRLVADPPLGGLQANAVPDPSDLPNNHLSYAFQWFLFAITAIVIFLVAARRRMAPAAPQTAA